MPKNKFQKLIFSIQETRRQLAENEISSEDALLIFNKLLSEYEEIKKSSESDDFKNFLKHLMK